MKQNHMINALLMFAVLPMASRLLLTLYFLLNY